MYAVYKDIVIRNAESKDCEQLAAWWNDGTIMAHAGFPNGLGITAETIRQKIASDRDDQRRRLIIEYCGKSIGEMSFSVYDGTKFEIGIKICDGSYQEKGLGRIILSLFIDSLFRQGASLIFLDTNLKNTRAQHVYELLGFRKLRVNENSWQDQLGSWQSSVDYELTKEDFHSFL